MIVDTRERLKIDDSLRAGPYQDYVFKQKRYCRLLDIVMELTRARDRLTMLVTVGTRPEAHLLRSQAGMGSELDC